MKYFKARNSRRQYAGVAFVSCYIVGSCTIGVAVLDEKDEKQAKQIEDLLNDWCGKNKPVEEVDRTEYDRCLKKKSPDLDSQETWGPREVSTPPKPPETQPGPSIKLPTAVVVNQPTAKPEGDEPVQLNAPVAAESAVVTAPVETAPAPEDVRLTDKQKARNFRK